MDLKRYNNTREEERGEENKKDTFAGEVL